ncbi:MAG: 2-(1,2-epoxy-1,2-dihydrophenyl)acetyl-CoA isomerase PaaG [Anaerolineae bacterium]
MSYETILYEQDDGILTITMNRPDRLNALTVTMLHELDDAFKRAEEDPAIRAVVLTGAGRGFCPGADLSAVQEYGPDFDFGTALREHYNPLILRMVNLPKPIIAAVNGAAAGAGMSLALACDLRIAAESASFLQAFVKIALVPDSGSTWLLSRLVGAGRALELALSGRRLSAQEACEWGMVNRVVPDEEFAAAVAEIARQYAGAPTAAIGYIKQAMHRGLTSTLAEALELEADLQSRASRLVDHQEGVTAFLEKRPPRFTGA